MKISVAMASYNGADYILDQLESLKNQHRKPDEIIIADDGSTDSTLDIIKEFSRSAPFEVICFCNKKNLGYAGNFNSALVQSNGDLVFLCDQDDVWFPEKIAYIEALANKHPELLVFMNDATFTDANLNELGRTKLGQLYTAGFTDKMFVMGCCCAIRRELLDICLPIPEGYKAHDTWIVSFADGMGKRYVSNKVLQYYRRHGSNESTFIANRTTRITRKDIFLQRLKSLKGIKDSGQADTQIQQMELLVSGIDRALIRSISINYKEILEKFLEEKSRDLELMRKRSLIRKMSMLPKFIAIVKHLQEGGYRGGTALKNVVRDFIE